jgi:hypothetical protein
LACYIFSITKKNKMSNTTVQDFEMFTPAGNRACQRLVDNITKKIHSKRRYTAEEFSQMLEEGQSAIAKTYGEIYDSEPRVHIAHLLSKELKKAGYGFYFDYFQDIQTA